MPSPLQIHKQTAPPGSPLDPLDALAHLAASSNDDILLLHSGLASGNSLLAFDPLCRLMVDGRGHAALRSWHSFSTLDPIPRSPLEVLQQLTQSVTFEADHPLIGWLGFLSYDIAQTLEKIPRFTPEELHWPLLAFGLFRHYLLFDSTAGTCTAYTLGRAGESLPNPWTALRNIQPSAIPTAGKSTLISRQSAAEYIAKIRRVREYIAAGDIYQANLAQRWGVQTADAPVDIFRRLCQISPAPYAVFQRITDDAGTRRHILSASPELFVAANAEGHIVTRPIKGTRPRDLTDAARDEALREELLDSAKDRAELAMIVDLLRNDLGRVSKFGSVRVTDPRSVEQHPTVWHTVATIDADLREDASLAELLAAICPGGSVTGAPKIRAMQIIEELEGFRRGLYCGNIGVIGSGGKSLALNIAIRTMLLQDGMAYLYAGGGIVADSLPELEYQETLYKAAAMFRSLGLDVPRYQGSRATGATGMCTHIPVPQVL